MTTPVVTADPIVRTVPAPARPVEEKLPPTMERVRIYVWQVPVRLTHWVTFGTLIALAVTGSYIADPFLITPGQDTMRLVRFVHIVAAYSFVASGIVRTYWLFAGNQFSRWTAFVPTNRHHLRELARQTQWYLFLRRDLPGILGHNALASGTYLVVFFLFLLQTATGFALVGIHGTQPWATLLGWLPGVLFGEQGVRLIHHLLMWAIIAFAIHHVYSALLVDHIERNGLLSSIFSGSKFVPRWRIVEARDGGIELDSIVRRQDIEESRAEALDKAMRGEE
ncbi:MAG TPA: Ni/Fe-hydrogenase, b-type cytochrome subunit [Candidatus Limnocylindrales bacterium]|nr:Ni/Fe-hydrogenase, b-type cytochrome subunit [Candidatus Limnocylindrales bacterium]